MNIILIFLFSTVPSCPDTFPDSFSLGLAWFLEKFSHKEKTNTFSYGYRRFSLLGALINALILLIGSLIIVIKLVPRFIAPQNTNAQGMFFIAILGVIVNGIGFYKTHKGKTLNERVVSLHLLEDVLGWISVLFVSIVMIFTKINILDPILSLLIILYILWGVFKNLKETLFLFLQAIPKNFSIIEIENSIKNKKEVIDVHDTHIWSLDGEKHILSAHIVIPEYFVKEDIEKIKKEIKSQLKNMGIKSCYFGNRI